MATEQPSINLYNPIVDALITRFEMNLANGKQSDDLELEVGPFYNVGFKQPYVAFFLADVLSARWKLATSQQELSRRLGRGEDHAWVSRAMRQGNLPMEVFVRLRFFPMRPEDWEPAEAAVLPFMERAAFIEVAKHLASAIRNRESLDADLLDELDYELICDMFGKLTEWIDARHQKDTAFALRLTRGVCRAPDRDIYPPWLTQQRTKTLQDKVARLLRDPFAALAYLERLHTNWLDVFAATARAVDAVSWSER